MTKTEKDWWNKFDERAWVVDGVTKSNKHLPGFPKTMAAILDDFKRLAFPSEAKITHSELVSNYLLPGLILARYPQLTGRLNQFDHLAWTDTFACPKRYAIRDTIVEACGSD